MSQLAPPPLSGLFYEALTWVEAPRMAFSLPALLSLRRGPGRNVWVLPGFGAGDTSTIPLRQYLSLMGHNVTGWQQGVNDGDVLGAVAEMGARVVEEYERTGKQIDLIGWSLGGIISREVARENPHAVRQVITLGSPLKGGPKYTRVSAVFEQLGTSSHEIEAMMIAREVVPIRVPVTSIYSKYDGIVAWQACIDDYTPDADHIEVATSHLGFGLSPVVFGHLAKKLAA